MKAYAKYKDSGIEWIGEIPEEWEVSKLKYKFAIINGATPKSNKSSYWNGNIMWITPADYKTDDIYIKNSRNYITETGLNSCGTTLVPINSIIVSNRAPIGNIGIAAKELCTNQGCKALVKIQDINEKFIFYYLSIMNSPLNMFGQGTTFLELSSKDLANFLIPLPSLSAQQYIVDCLDHKTSIIDSLIHDKQKLISLLKEKRQAIISEAVTKGLDKTAKMKDSGIEWIGKIPEEWDIKKICYIAAGHNGDRGKEYPSGKDMLDEGIPFISTSELINGKIVLDNVSYISSEKYEKLGGLKIKENDIIYCLRGSVGKNGIALFNDGTIASSLMAIRCYNVLPKFLMYVLNSSFEEKQRNYLTTGSVSANLSAENVMRFMFPLPNSEKEQIEIVNYLDKKTVEIDTLISDITEQINKLKEYRQAVISEAVTGKVAI